MTLNRKPILKSTKLRVGITFGDPSGIGPEIIAKALEHVAGRVNFTIIGDKRIFDYYKPSSPGLPDYKFIDLNNVERNNFCFGKVRAEYGKASIEYLDKALGLIKEKEIDCLVTCPISKEATGLSGFTHAGHTGYLAQKTGSAFAVMMLVNKSLRMALLTQHLALNDVTRSLNQRLVVKTIELTNFGLKQLFRINKPRIVVCALNPHASDNGLIGNEERLILKPALKRLKISVSGPESADIAISKAYRGDYDAVIAIYHDQALIPLKLVDDRGGVNLTLGLDFIRTSPLHGTAFDIAGKNKASPVSLIEAIELAIKCTLNRRRA
ncbi:MAG: 4-hydroxythreonine-4-phosphate dehydrogenase PdxA [Candidatus Omnitrophota bacterium]|nr:4-hydroxythreonine-4-phosphate dehydrogenase PdxA [Candidatus Omnitrophota bacterium]